jgi:hypothetical protein
MTWAKVQSQSPLAAGFFLWLLISVQFPSGPHQCLTKTSPKPDENLMPEKQVRHKVDHVVPKGCRQRVAVKKKKYSDDYSGRTFALYQVNAKLAHNPRRLSH